MELADLVEHLPAGCALGRAIGGEAAVSNEVLLIRAVELTLRNVHWASNGGKGQQPEPIPLPGPAGQTRAKTVTVEDRARVWKAQRERQARQDAATL